MTLTKKHFIAIAYILKSNDAIHLEDITRKYKGEDIINNLGDYFKAENVNFDREKFLKACGVVV